MSEQTEVDQKVPADRDSLDLLDSLNVEQTANGDQIRPAEVEAIREFLSARNLKTVRNDSSRRSSSCFGRRMDRIGSMSSLGCNTVGKSSKSSSSSANTGFCGRTRLEVLTRVPSGTQGRNFTHNCDVEATFISCFLLLLQIQSEVLASPASPELLPQPYLLPEIYDSATLFYLFPSSSSSVWL